jgi:ATP-binding cassette, subfamily B, bacterial
MEPTKSFAKKNARVLHFLFSLSPSYVFSYIFYFLLKAFLPYIPIYGGALIIDAVVAGKSVNETMLIVYAMIGTTLGVALLTSFLTYFLQAFDNKILAEVNRMTSKKTHEISYAQLEDIKTLRLIKAADEATNGSGGVPSYMRSIGYLIEGISSLVYSCLLLQGIFVSGTPSKVDGFSTFLNNPWSSLVLFGAVVLALLASLPLAGLSNKLSYKAMIDNVEGNRRFGYFYDLCNDYEAGKDIRLFHMQKMIMNLQENDKYGVNATWEKFCHSDILIKIATALFFAALSFVAYGYLGLKALYGLISIGSAVAYAGAVTLLATGAEEIIMGLIGLSLNADYLQNYFLYLALPNSMSYGQEKLDEKAPLSVEFRHVSFTYPNQKEKALDDVSLAIKPGEKLAIVGANGAGKTTLIKLVCRLYEPDAGEILVNGKPIASYDQPSLERLYAIVFQDFKLFSFSIKDNVASSDNGDEAKVVDSLKKANIYGRVMNFPKGLETILYNKNDENGVEISGGEAQKIAIARALYKNSPLVILDEPTSALDPKSEAEVYEKFATLVEGKTAVFISHRMSSTKFCDQIAVVDQGHIVEYGNHESLLKNKDGLYKKMWDAQAQYYR